MHGNRRISSTGFVANIAQRRPRCRTHAAARRTKRDRDACCLSQRETQDWHERNSANMHKFIYNNVCGIRTSLTR